MKDMPTKERILYSALDLFSEKGYDGVGVDLIAENAGLKGPSLYRHYKGKEDIFSSLIDMVESHYTKGFGLKNTEVGFPESMEVFCKYDAPEYSEEGICEFRKSLDDPERTSF